MCATKSMLVFIRLSHLLSWCREQNPIMDFVVNFLKMITLYMLWSCQFLTELHAVFCVHQILISGFPIHFSARGGMVPPLGGMGDSRGGDLGQVGGGMPRKTSRQ